MYPDEEMRLREMSDPSRVTLPVSNWSRIQSQFVWLQTPCHNQLTICPPRNLALNAVHFVDFLSFFLFLTMPHGLRDVSSLTRDETRALCSGSIESHHWTTREVPMAAFFKSLIIGGLGYFLSFAIIDKTMMNIVVIKSLSTSLTFSLL